MPMSCQRLHHLVLPEKVYVSKGWFCIELRLSCAHYENGHGSNCTGHHDEQGAAKQQHQGESAS